jgi:hypothetical protein
MGQFRPIMDKDHIELISSLIEHNPDWHRTRLSKELCEIWGWQSGNGQIKDISCRDLLRDLDKAGIIRLPPARHLPRRPGIGADKIASMAHNDDDIAVSLDEVRPLQIEIAKSKEDISAFKSYINQYHYLGFDRSIGENIKYFVRSCNGIPLACLMFGSSAWKCRARDEYIGWSSEQRCARLHLVTNNSRNLIFPWVRIPHLASHILGKVARRISRDFQSKYGHPIALLETFVEAGRFCGTCYKAANWVYAGSTTGRGRDSQSCNATLPLKDVWLYPLQPLTDSGILRGGLKP